MRAARDFLSMRVMASEFEYPEGCDHHHEPLWQPESAQPGSAANMKHTNIDIALNCRTCAARGPDQSIWIRGEENKPMFRNTFVMIEQAGSMTDGTI